MSLLKLIRKISGSQQPTEQNALSWLHSRAVMEVILNRERTRAERVGLELSLVIFSVSDPEKAYSTLAQVALQLKQRLRCTDVMGWNEEGKSLAAVFPHVRWPA